MKKKVVWIGLAALPALAFAAALALARVSQRPGEAGAVGLVNGRLRACPETPNCVCSEAEAGDAAIEPLAFDGDAELAWRSLRDFVEREEDAEVVEARDDYLHVVWSTSLLRFADDVEFRLDPEAGVIHVRSQSRVGHSDLGANRARVEGFRERWNRQADGT